MVLIGCYYWGSWGQLLDMGFFTEGDTFKLVTKLSSNNIKTKTNTKINIYAKNINLLPLTVPACATTAPSTTTTPELPLF